MTGRKLGYFKFLNESMKKPMVERRKVGLFKKAKELSVLCDVEVGIVMYAQNQRDPIVWPSMELATQRFARFLSLPEPEKVKKMVTHEKYLRDRIDAEVEKIRKKERENERKEMDILMNQIIDGRSLNEMDARQLKGLYIVAGEKMQELEKRRRDLQLNEGGGDTATTAASSNHGQPSAALTIGPFADDYNNNNKMTLLVGGASSLFSPTLPRQGGGDSSYGGGRQDSFIGSPSNNPNNGGGSGVIGKEGGGDGGNNGGSRQLINNYSFTGSPSINLNNDSGGSVIGKEVGGGGNNGGCREVINNHSFAGSHSTNTNNGSGGVIGNEGGGNGGGSKNDGGSQELVNNYSFTGSPSINTNNDGGGVKGNEGGGFPNMELPNVTANSSTSPSLHTNNPHPQDATLNQVWPYNFFSS